MNKKTLPELNSEKINNLLLFILSVTIFHLTYGIQTIIPTNIAWLMEARHDWGTHYLGFYYFRNEDWGFPLGDIHAYNYPVSTNVGYTDSIPLFAIFFKIFSFLLPEDFQYFGFWLMLCYILTAYYVLRIGKHFGLSRGFIFLLTLLVLINPALAYRGMHPALCSHWMLLASFCFFIGKNPYTALRNQLLLFLLSALVNPYMCAMVGGFTVILPLKHYLQTRYLSLKKTVAYLALSFSGLLFLWFVTGMLRLDGEKLSVDNAFGLYSLNLNALYNAKGFSNLLPAFKDVSWHQYEGFMYLGAGMMVLVVMALGYSTFLFVRKYENIKKRIAQHRISILLLGILCTGYAIFAITHIITFEDKVLLKLPAPKTFLNIGNIFRASARFFWLPYYILLLAPLLLLLRSPLPKRLKYFILLGATCLQFYDTLPLLTHRKLRNGDYTTPLADNEWLSIMKNFEEIRFVPPFNNSQLNTLDYQDFSFLAAKLRKPITIGYVARMDEKKMRHFTDSIFNELENGTIPQKALYVTTYPNLPIFAGVYLRGKAQIHTLNGYYYIFSTDSVLSNLHKACAILDKHDSVSIKKALAAIGEKQVFQPLPPHLQAPADTLIHYYFDRLNITPELVSADGWGFIKNTDDNSGDSTFITLSTTNQSFFSAVSPQKRPDITQQYKKTNLDNAGFKLLAHTTDVPPGKYHIGIAIKNKNGLVRHAQNREMVQIGRPQEQAFTTLAQMPPSEELVYNFDIADTTGTTIKLAGWSYRTGESAAKNEIIIVLHSSTSDFQLKPDVVSRPDIANARKLRLNMDDCGFETTFERNRLASGTYQVGIILKNKNGKKTGMTLTGIKFNVPSAQ
ncbi:DUF6311 domain-containing protein [Parasegetibacter sp. NRK P23]|uniref:DUF6311 domain-containing protein n=1 Tax=Parasegetibacter sp. NRK P23 TaxID=2942999 RepID=UPI002043CBEF|nr:DUF6311 domain-containing protein [Parasegetibacter sp. NRK P23]MCM5527507.1 DUF6311 domain-containing protein [Parasegetibacter sp. NRK P23]